MQLEMDGRGPWDTDNVSIAGSAEPARQQPVGVMDASRGTGDMSRCCLSSLLLGTDARAVRGSGPSRRHATYCVQKHFYHDESLN